MMMSYALDKADVEKIIDGAKRDFNGHRFGKAYMVTRENGQELFISEIEGIAKLTFAMDENGIFQLENSDDVKHLQIISIVFNVLVKEYTGKDWPTVVAA